MTTPSDVTAPASLADIVRRRLTTSPGPLKFADVIKGIKKPAKKPKADFEAEFRQLLDDEIRAGRVYRYPSGPKGAERFWGRDEKQQLADEAVQVASEPRTMAFLKKDLTKPFKSDGAFVEALVRELVAEKRLHQHPSKKGPSFGVEPPPPPPPWHAQVTLKKDVEAAVKAVSKLATKAGVTADEVLGLLRARLRGAEQSDAVAPPPPDRPAARVEQPQPTATPVRAVLKAAYDHLCKFVEFRDRLVELPRLYHEAAERMPGLTAPEFHRELLALSDERAVELHVLNEVATARERHLAIDRGDRVYYFVMWKDRP